MSEQYRNCSSTLTAFLAGAAVGSVLALLMAPRSGAETREIIRDAAEDLRKKAETLAEEAETRVRDVVKEGIETIDEKKQVVRAAVDAGKDAYQKSKESGKKA